MENICFEAICSGKGYAPSDMNNLFHRDRLRVRWERGREEKRVNFTTRKMRIYRPFARKGRGGCAPEAKR